MNAVASFRRIDQGPDQVVFDIEPASPSGMFVLITFLSQVVLTLFLGSIIFAVITATLEQPLIGAILGITIPFILFWVVEWRYFFMSQKYRRHRQIKVTPQGLDTEDQHIPLEQVTHLELRASGSEPEEAPVVMQSDELPEDRRMMDDRQAMDDESRLVMAQADDLIPEVADPARGQMAERSYLLTMRPKQSSELAVLAGGLTLDCGEALLHDLSDAIREKMPHAEVRR
jgi:hypothetical protein